MRWRLIIYIIISIDLVDYYL